MKSISLPLDVYKRIFQYHLADDRPTLLALRASSMSFRDLCTSLAFREVDIEGSVNGGRKLRRMFGLGPGVTQYVQHLMLKANDDQPDPCIGRLLIMNVVFAFSLVPWPRLTELIRLSSFTICLPADGELQCTFLRGLRFLPPGSLKTLSIVNFPADNQPVIMADPHLRETLCAVHTLHLHVTFVNRGRYDPQVYAEFWNRKDLFLNFTNVHTLSMRLDKSVLGSAMFFQNVHFPHLESLHLQGFILGDQQPAHSFILSHAKSLTSLKLVQCPIVVSQSGLLVPSDAETWNLLRKELRMLSRIQVAFGKQRFMLERRDQCWRVAEKSS